MIKEYQANKERYKTTLQSLSRQQQIISLGRLLSIVACITLFYLYFKHDNNSYLFGAIALLVAFFALVKRYGRNKEQIDLTQMLIKINEDEITYLDKGILNFDPGAEFIDSEHPYTYDLDVFGEDSLFQHVNRTGTLIGKLRLSRMFIQQNLQEIQPQQEAINELAPAVEWRQRYAALGKLYISREEDLERFNNWLTSPAFFLKRRILVALFYILPAVTILALTALLYFKTPVYYSIFSSIFILNMILVGLNIRHFKKENLGLERVSKILSTYSHLLKSIESGTFKSAKLQRLQKSIFTDHTSAASAISKLARVLGKFESQNNIFASLIMNGLLLDAMHTMLGLERWRSKYATHVPDWMQVIAEWDALSSLANFYCNNDHFIFPVLSEQPQMSIEAAGHPLIHRDKRVYNDICFENGKFIILTGSNMSGKSTFLRTIGISLLLARMGAPVCATRCHIFPFEIFVSMKINDSLANNESLFFAELKRLRRIIDQIEEQKPTFVILDEILRGTNSNDKHTGTSSLIRKLAAFGTYGIIATHDLTISDMTSQYPGYLKNECFEVEILEDRLHFDYKLKPGVCAKMSAVFLMKQMEII